MPAQRPPRLTVLSAFTGAGGLDLGLEAAGFETVGCIEKEPNARATILANRPEWNLLATEDILDIAKELRPKDVGLRRRQLSVLAGGPPCQPFSTAAQWADSGMAGLSDPRSLSLHAFLQLIDRFLPQVVLIENVVGFASGRNSAVPLIEAALAEISHRSRTHYRLQVAILQATHFGVPQRRRRAILVARRDGKRFVWPTPTHVDAPVRSYDALWNVQLRNVPVASGYWAELLPSIPAGQNYQYHTPRGGGLPLFGHRRWFWSFLLKLDPDQPSWTIQAQPGPATGPFHWDNRPLAPEELARLQSFPAEWKFCGNAKAQQQQIGNATPPLLAEVIGRALAESVFGKTFEGDAKLRIERRTDEIQLPEPVPGGHPLQG